MTGEPTRAQLENENELICALLLGLKQVTGHCPPSAAQPDGAPAIWTNGRTYFDTPLFAAWAGVSMIVDQYAAMQLDFFLYGESAGTPEGTSTYGWYVELPELDVQVGPFAKSADAVRASAVAVVTKYQEERNAKRKIQD